MILETIKKDNIVAMKEKNANARAILSILMNKALLEQVKRRETGVEFTDVDMIAILQKTIKELTEEAENYAKVGNNEEVNTIKSQISIVEKYLPQMMSETEIEKIISEQADKSVPNIMKLFKANYAGKVDMRMVSAVLKKFN